MSNHHRLRTTLSIAACSAAALTFAAGCGSDDSSSAGSAPKPSSPPAVTTLETSTGSQQVTPAGDIAVGQTATFQTLVVDGAESFDAPVRVGISKITKGGSSDLEIFDYDKKDQDLTPYYVKASFRNLSPDKSWNPLGMPGAFIAFAKGGEQVGTITLVGDFPKCEDDRPSTLKPGQTMRTCTVFLVPKGDTLDRVIHRDSDSDEYIWSAS